MKRGIESLQIASGELAESDVRERRSENESAYHADVIVVSPLTDAELARSTQPVQQERTERLLAWLNVRARLVTRPSASTPIAARL